MLWGVFIIFIKSVVIIFIFPAPDFFKINPEYLKYLEANPNKKKSRRDQLNQDLFQPTTTDTTDPPNVESPPPFAYSNEGHNIDVTSNQSIVTRNEQTSNIARQTVIPSSMCTCLRRDGINSTRNNSHCNICDLPPSYDVSVASNSLVNAVTSSVSQGNMENNDSQSVVESTNL